MPTAPKAMVRVTEDRMHQSAPYPHVLADLVSRLRFRPGWTFDLFDQVRDKDAATREPTTDGLTLDIVTKGYDSYHPERGETYRVHHYRIVPAATYNEQSWQRWLLEQCMIVDDHEACEFFATTTPCTKCVDGTRTIRVGSMMTTQNACPTCDGTGTITTRPFAPNHGPGFDPYRVVEYETDEARRTSFRGDLKPDAHDGSSDWRASADAMNAPLT